MDAPEFPTLTTSRLRPLFAVLRTRGVDVDGCLRSAGTDEATLLTPLHRMPREVVLRLLARLGLDHELDELGLEVADAVEARDLDLLGHLLASARTVGDALQLAVRYVRLIHDSVELEFRRQGDIAILSHSIGGGRVQLPPVADFSVAMTVRLFREMTGGALPLLEVKLARPRPPRPANYSKWFGVPVSFDAKFNELQFHASVLECALPKANASLNEVLQRQANELLRALSDSAQKPTFVERVRFELSASLEEGDVSASELARTLRIAERTLRRRLNECGTSYRELLDDVRRERALVLAQHPKLSISQVANQLGFSGPTSFGRAFRRWTGMMPTQYARAARVG